MSFSVECRLPDPSPGTSPTFQTAASLEDATKQAEKWIRTYHGEADIFDIRVSNEKPIMTHQQIVAGMDAR
jgi:hypothetical protein